VDDTPDLRALVRMALERRGDFRVIAEAGDGREGVHSAQAHQPDVVLLDIAMPVMSGLEALPLIREASPGSAVIMLSGFGADRMAAQAVEAGADGYIQKGQPIRALLAQVHSLVEAAQYRGTLDRRVDDERRGDHTRTPGLGEAGPDHSPSDGPSPHGDEPGGAPGLVRSLTSWLLSPCPAF
jgi:DNA-binding NarL/FixJ family response regulator